MTVTRPFTTGAVVLIVAALAVLPATPARSHGATSQPVSRAVACAPDAGLSAGSAACRAAVAAGGRGFDEWDNVRVPDVRGRDRQRIPDGRLCSGGLDDFRGLDLPRADWPATTVSPGRRYTFRYGQRIPHQGTFRLYVTRPGYSPTRPLRWSDVEGRPFLTTTDPPLRGDAYVFTGLLPSDRDGRHVIFTIWQNSDTPDTYYSCSDVVFTSGARPVDPAPGSGRSPVGTQTGGPAARPGGTQPAGTPPSSAAAPAVAAGNRPLGGSMDRVILILAGGAAVVIALAAGALIGRRRRPGAHGRPPSR